MNFKHLVFALLAVSALTAGVTLSAPAQAGVNVDLVIGVPPPEPRYEPMPEPRDGYVWVQGYWGWVGDRHEWVRGYWEPERRGYAYRPAHWDREDDHWRFREGGWEQRQEERREERREEERREEYREERHDHGRNEGWEHHHDREDN